MLPALGDDNPFFRRRRLKPRYSRGFLRAFSIVYVGLSLIFGGLYGWFVYDETTWSETDATIVSREVRPKGVDLGVEFDLPNGGVAATTFAEWSTVHAVGETVRIRYAVSSSGKVRNARLAEEPIVRPGFFVTTGVVLVFGLGLMCWAWWLMPPDGGLPSVFSRRRRDPAD